ncbi:MAG TPA: GNAT family N-acetyltransferase [Dongiaceae bacterium]|jgi:RimJ/RimL family protein N-acetyltransferase
MPRAPLIIDTARLRLRSWQVRERDAFAALHADPAVMQDYGGPIDRAASDAKLNRYRAAYDRRGICRWAIETRAGDFLGYAGVMPVDASHPLGAHFDIGWRLKRAAWGSGYAVEAAEAALDDAFRRPGLSEVLAYTSADNLRSQATIARLRLQRDAVRDFVAEYEGPGSWRGLVWVARRH